jgi:hypothetical protein
MRNTRLTLTIEVLDRAAAIEKLPHELDDLATRALEPNVFNEALMFIPALQLIDVEVPLWIACVRDPSGLLQGVVPLVRQPMRQGLPSLVLRNWVHRYCSLGTPMLDAGCARQVLEALAQWIETGKAPAGGLQWVRVRWDGPFAQLVRQTFGSSASSESWNMDVLTKRRALLERTPDMKSPISGKHAKELRRLERRLAADGAVTYEVMQAADDWQAWYADFLRLEASGWKGAEGSAIHSKPQDAEFFRRVLAQAHAGGQLQLMRLAVAGKPVAMKLNLRSRGSRDGSYSLKIAHDENYAQFSPGVLLELFNMKVFAHEPDHIRWMDSCAEAHHPMIDRLWSGRREIATVSLARHGALLRTFVSLRPVIRRLKHAWPAGNFQWKRR